MLAKFNQLFLTGLILALAPLARGQSFELLHSFQNADGSPFSELIQATDGNFYGTTLSTVFRVTPSGGMTTLVSFQYTNGMYPTVGLLQGNDGDLYSTTTIGGDVSLNGGAGFGTIFKITTNGSLTTLALFNGTNGADARGLVQATDGNFYGITVKGGAYHSEAGWAKFWNGI